MSYRSVKNMLGETNLERKCFFLFGGCLLTLIAGSFWWYSSETDELVNDASRRTGRSLVDAAMLRHHFEMWETNEESKKWVVYLGKNLGNLEYRYRFIQPLDSGPSAPQDEFEADVLSYYLNDPDPRPFREQPLAHKGEYQYFQPVRAKKGCIRCHQSLGDQRIAAPEVHEGDLMAVAKVVIPYGEALRAQSRNRAILAATAIVTVFLAMIASYLIVRYVIVKPLKHLRDVSDEISRGNLSLRADIHTGDEFEDLGLAFNRMLRHLTTIQEELRNANSSLDSRLDELAQLNMQLFEMNRLKSEFLAMMSHELRTPLNAIIGFSDVLQSIPSLDEKQKRYVKNIQTSGRVLLEMINDILDLAKIESGKMEVRLSDFRVDNVIAAQCNMSLPETERKNIGLETQIDPGLPEMFQDQAKVQQILANLLSNAIKFTPEGGRIVVGARRSLRDELILTVSDTGVGIAEEDKTAIFEKFRQGKTVVGNSDSMAREYSGTGLGLSIVKELCKLLGGEVSLESELGKGSTFTVRLPWTRADQPRLDAALGTSLEELAKLRRNGTSRAVEGPVPAALNAPS